MADFGDALASADRALARRDAVGAEERVWARLRGPRRARWQVATPLALAAAIVALWLFVTPEAERLTTPIAERPQAQPPRGALGPTAAAPGEATAPLPPAPAGPARALPARKLPAAPNDEPPIRLAPEASASPAPAEPGIGVLIGIAIGGQCAFAVDGEARGRASSIKVRVPVGRHVVSCTNDEGATRTQAVMVTVDKPGIASFKL